MSSSVATAAANTFSTVHYSLAVSNCALQIHPTVTGALRNARFAQAQLAWQKGAHVASVDHGWFWATAAASLVLDGDNCSIQIHQLLQLLGLPDAMQTPAQNGTYRADVAALNAFFGTRKFFTDRGNPNSGVRADSRLNPLCLRFRHRRCHQGCVGPPTDCWKSSHTSVRPDVNPERSTSPTRER
jgi:hypothetical protein